VRAGRASAAFCAILMQRQLALVDGIDPSAEYSCAPDHAERYRDMSLPARSTSSRLCGACSQNNTKAQNKQNNNSHDKVGNAFLDRFPAVLRRIAPV